MGLLPRNQDRLTLDLAAIGLPEVPLVGVHNQTRASHGLAPHVHPGAMEICYLVRGERTYHVGGRDYMFRGNEIFVTLPDELHGSGHHVHGKGMLYWLQVRLPNRPTAFLGLAGREAWPLVQGLRQIPERRFRGERRLQGLFAEVVRLAQEEQHALQRLSVATRLVQWLLMVLRCAAQDGGRMPSPDMKAVLQSIDARLDQPLRLDPLAESVHLSVSRFKAKFKEQMGMPPGEYILRRKIERARALLAAGQLSITEVAYELGFSSSQYFATVFKRYTGARPRDARNAK